MNYSDAITLYADTCLSINYICEKTGGFVCRSYPEAVGKHKALLVSSHQHFAIGIEILRNSNPCER